MMQVDASSTQASENQAPSNVLFEPEIYRPVEDEPMMDDARSVSTHAGINASMISNYTTNLDPSLFSANRM
jgi:hypothetical protein